MSRIRYTAWLTLLAVLLAACGGDDGDVDDDAADDATEEEAADEADGDDGAEEAEDEGPVIGVSWNNFQEERWPTWDEPAIREALDDFNASYISTDASSSAEQQIEDVQNLITQGADALIILAQDGTAILPAVESALEQGIPVIAYDRLIEAEEALYITFDNVEVGRMQAREIYERVPEGNYVFIKGNQADANADFLRSGQAEVLDEAIEAGDIENVGESYTDNWDPTVAQRNMEQFLTENDNNVDADVASNDGTAGGVIAALESQGLAGDVPVSGQDADGAALNRVALGTQTVTVWKDARDLGYQAGEAAVLLAEDTPLEEIPGTVTFDSPGGNQLISLLLEPIPITQENLDLVVDAGWISEDELCQGVEPGTVDACG